MVTDRILKILAIKSASHQMQLRRLGQECENAPLSENIAILPQGRQVMGINTLLLDRAVDRVEFRFYFDRLMTTMIEKAVDLVPVDPVQIRTPCGYGYKGSKAVGEVCHSSLSLFLGTLVCVPSPVQFTARLRANKAPVIGKRRRRPTRRLHPRDRSETRHPRLSHRPHPHPDQLPHRRPRAPLLQAVRRRQRTCTHPAARSANGQGRGGVDGGASVARSRRGRG